MLLEQRDLCHTLAPSWGQSINHLPTHRSVWCNSLLIRWHGHHTLRKRDTTTQQVATKRFRGETHKHRTTVTVVVVFPPRAIAPISLAFGGLFLCSRLRYQVLSCAVLSTALRQCAPSRSFILLHTDLSFTRTTGTGGARPCDPPEPFLPFVCRARFVSNVI